MVLVRTRLSRHGSSGNSNNDKLEIFIELVLLRMRSYLVINREIGELIEVVLDLGRKPISRQVIGSYHMSLLIWKT